MPCRRRCAASACSTGRRSRARSASRSTSTSSRPSPKPSPTASGRCRRVMRRPIRPVVQGVHPRRWWPGVFAELAEDRPAAASPSASTTTSPTPACPTTRRSTSRRPTRCAPSSSASAPTAPSAPTRTPSRSSAPRPDLHAQGYFVYDSKKSGSQTVSHLRFGPRPIHAAYLVSERQLHRLPPVQPAGSGGRARPGRPGRHLAAQLPLLAGRGLGRAVPSGAGADPGQEPRASTPSTPAGSPAQAGLAGRINTIMQTCFFAISGVLPPEQAIARIKESIAKTYGKRGRGRRRAQPGGRRQHPGRAAPHQGSGPGDGDPRTAAAGARPMLPSSCASVTAEMMAGRGDALAGQRPAGGRHLSGGNGGVREAQHLRPRRRVGRRHLHPVRQLQLRLPAQRHPLQVLRRRPAGRRPGRFPLGAARRRRPSRHPLHPPGLRRGLHRLRAVRGGLPGRRAGRVTRTARRKHQGDQHRCARAASSTPSARTSPSSRRSRSPTAPGWTSGRCAARSSSSRCSSSPVPARDAARRLT